MVVRVFIRVARMFIQQSKIRWIFLNMESTMPVSRLASIWSVIQDGEWI